MRNKLESSGKIILNASSPQKKNSSKDVKKESVSARLQSTSRDFMKNIPFTIYSSKAK